MRSQLWQHTSRQNASPSQMAETFRGGDLRAVLVFALLGLALSFLAIGQGESIGYDHLAELLNLM
jgi:hypothetical protein